MSERESLSGERCPHCQSLLPVSGVAVLDEVQDRPESRHVGEQLDRDAWRNTWRNTRGIFGWSQGDPPAEVIVRQMRDATRR